MQRNFNLPPGCSQRDIDGDEPETETCDNCGREFYPHKLRNGVCKSCQREIDEENDGQ